MESKVEYGSDVVSKSMDIIRDVLESDDTLEFKLGINSPKFIERNPKNIWQVIFGPRIPEYGFGGYFIELNRGRMSKHSLISTFHEVSTFSDGFIVGELKTHPIFKRIEYLSDIELKYFLHMSDGFIRFNLNHK